MRITPASADEEVPFNRTASISVGSVRRLVIVGLLLGLANGVAAAGALYAVHKSAPKDFGWFAYAPLNENVEYDYYGFPWEYVVVPTVLVLLNALLLPLLVRRGWLG